MVCVHDFPRGEVSMKVGVMEYRLYSSRPHEYLCGVAPHTMNSTNNCSKVWQTDS